MQETRKKRFVLFTLLVGLLPALLGFGLLGVSKGQSAAVNFLTHHLDNMRTGWNDKERTLTPDNIRNGGLEEKWFIPRTEIDGQVYAAPLYYRMDDQELLIITTETNKVYFLDAAKGIILDSFLVGEREGAPERALTQAEFDIKLAGGCADINGPHGITGTPVIDPETNTLYLVNLTLQDSLQVYKAHAIDLATRRELPGWPVTIRGAFLTRTFQAFMQTQRGALTLHDGMLYIPFSSRCDAFSWHGWVMGVDVNNPSAPPYVFCTSPDGGGAGIWGPGGLSLDNGGLYAVTGNGDVNFRMNGSYGMSVLRLDPANSAQPFSYTNRDYFTISDYGPANNRDTDLGGSSAVIIPDQTGTSTPHLLLTAGKDGRAYLVNRDNLGGLGAELKRLHVSDGMRVAPSYFSGEDGKGGSGNFVYVTGTGAGRYMDWEDNLNNGTSENVAISSGPAMAEFNKRLFIAWVNNTETREIMVKSSPDGTTWTAPRAAVGGAAAPRTSPALAVFDPGDGARLYVAWTDDRTRQIMIKSSADGADWSAAALTLDRVPDTTYASLAVFSGKLYLAFINNTTAHEIVLRSTSDGMNWSGNITVHAAGPTPPMSAPFIIPFDKKLYAFWARNADDRTLVYKSSADGQDWTGDPTSFNETLYPYSGVTGLVMNSVVESPDPGPERLHIFFLSNNRNRNILVRSLPNIDGTGNQTTYESGTGGQVGTVYFRGRPRMAYGSRSETRGLSLKAGAAGYNGKGLTALRLTTDAGGRSTFHPVWTSTTNFDYLPGSPFITSDGRRNGIVWVTENLGQGILHAYNAVTGEELFPFPDRLRIGGRKFEETVVVNGRIYVAADGVAAYGLR